jgi:Fuseless
MILSPSVIWKKIFRHKQTLREVWRDRIKAFLIGAGIVLFWRGIWNLADHYLFPNHPDISAFASLAIGLGILILSHNFVNQFLDEAVEEAGELE